MLAPQPKESHGHKRYPSPGRCIYCGDTSGPLSDEHIVPKGLGGTWVLEGASCPACAKITCDFEGVVQGHMLGNYRISVGLSRSKRHKEAVEIEFLDEARNSSIEAMPVREAPTGFSLPVFHPADFFERRSAKDSHLRGTWGVAMNWDFHRQSKEYGRFGFLIGSVKTHHFARMIAKIAHAYAIAELGLIFAPDLADVILRGQQYRGSIGSDLMRADQPTEEWFHRLHLGWKLRGGLAWPVVGVQLFCPYRAPIYHALVGPIPLHLLSERLDQKGATTPG